MAVTAEAAEPGALLGGGAAAGGRRGWDGAEDGAAAASPPPPDWDCDSSARLRHDSHGRAPAPQKPLPVFVLFCAWAPEDGRGFATELRMLRLLQCVAAARWGGVKKRCSIPSSRTVARILPGPLPPTQTARRRPPFHPGRRILRRRVRLGELRRDSRGQTPRRRAPPQRLRRGGSALPCCRGGAAASR